MKFKYFTNCMVWNGPNLCTQSQKPQTTFQQLIHDKILLPYGMSIMKVTTQAQCFVEV